MGQIISKEKKQKREGLMAQMKDKTEGSSSPTKTPTPRTELDPGQHQPHPGVPHLPPAAGQGQWHQSRPGGQPQLCHPDSQPQN